MLAAHPAVAECAVLGIADELEGQVPVGLVVLKDGAVDLPEEALEQELVRIIRRAVGAVAGFQGGRGGAPAQDPLRQNPAQNPCASSPTASTSRRPRPSRTQA